MNSFCFKVINTLKVEYSCKERPSESEIITFLKESDVNLRHIVGFYGSETEDAFFVKFDDNHVLQSGLISINTKANITVKDNVYDVRAVLIASFVADVYLHNIPFEISNEELSKKLSKYGKVQKIEWQKCKIEEDLAIYNGIRIATMEINEVIPPYVYIFDVKVRAFFKYQKDMCYKCSCIAHHRNTCTTTTLNATNTDKQNSHDNEYDKTSDTKSVVEKQGNDSITGDFEMVCKKVKKKQEAQAISQPKPEIPERFKVTTGKKLFLDRSLLSTGMFITGSESKFRFGGKDYPNGIEGRFLSPKLLKRVRSRMCDGVNRKIGEIIMKAIVLEVKLIWFLFENTVYYEVEK